jgi:hypothetical protein
MRQMVNGRVVDVPTDADGTLNSDSLRQVAGVPPERPLILQLPDGSNRLVNAGERLQVKPEQYFVDAPAHRRGR